MLAVDNAMGDEGIEDILDCSRRVDLEDLALGVNLLSESGEIHE